MLKSDASTTLARWTNSPQQVLLKPDRSGVGPVFPAVTAHADLLLGAPCMHHHPAPQIPPAYPPASRLRRAVAALLTASVSLYAALSTAAEPATSPLLRLDPGEHTATINRIATDKDGRWLVTASIDKTARVWNLVTGQISVTLRVPQGPGNEGKLYAVALSPDGTTVAVGGWTGHDWDGSHSIYLFDRISGRLLRRLDGLPKAVLDLAFSPDGRRLAAALASGGIRLFDAVNGRLLDEDSAYAKASASVDFSPDGRRLVATCEDGELRLYEITGSGLRLKARRAAAGGQDPFFARFSPDGRRIGVGFKDKAAVMLLDGETLVALSSADTTDLNKDRHLGTIAWSRDGAWLFAAGQAQRDGKWFIRRWPVTASGTGAPDDWLVADSTIFDLAALPGGRLAFTAGEPTWGMLDANGQRRWYHAALVADFRDNRKGFTLSADGTRVGFAYTYGGVSPATFDTSARTLLAGASEGLNPPRFSAPGVEVKNWMKGFGPTLNGTPLTLDQNERSRSLALVPGAGGGPGGLVLGTEWNLRASGMDGTERWKQAAPGVVWAVNASADGRWVVAAYGDGTIRWHRAADGAEQLALYPHPDRKRWVLWTPSGYYDASPGAEDLIGWHVNRGKDRAADFFPASRFRAAFYRPDVIAAVLDSTDEATALARTGSEGGRRTLGVDITRIQPPVVRIASPADQAPFSQSRVTLAYRVRTLADAPLTGVKVLVDGRPLEEARGLRPRPTTAGPLQDGEQEYRIEVNLPARDLILSVIAENRHGTSAESSVRMTWAGAAPADILKPRLYVLAIGVSRYGIADPLGFADKDARDVAAAFSRQKQLFREVIVKVLPNATSAELLEGLEWLRDMATANDITVFFFAGHGVKDRDNDFYFLPREADPAKLRLSAVPHFDVRKTLRALRGKVWAFIDTCHAGTFAGTRGMLGDINSVASDLADADNGVIVFASSTGRQQSLENADWNNGAFTKALVEGLDGQADYSHDGVVTVAEMEVWLGERVKNLTGNRQTPTTTKPPSTPDMPLALVR